MDTAGPTLNAQQRMAKRHAAVGKHRPLLHAPFFWLGLTLFLIAITVYLASGDPSGQIVRQ